MVGQTGGAVGWVLEAAWLNRERATAWLALLSIGNVFGFVVAICLVHGWGLPGKPHASGEFMGFYAAGRLVDEGQALAAYAPGMPVAAYIASNNIAPAHVAMQRAVAGDPALDVFAFFYPPVSWLAFAPLARLAFYPAFFLWIAITAGIGGLALRAVLGGWRRVWPAAAYVAVYQNAGVGETAFLIGGFLGGGFLVLRARPVLAGLCFGLLCFKPTYLLPVGLLLVLGGHWRALLAMGICAALVCLLADWCFGWRAWLDYFTIVAPHAAWMLRHHGFAYNIQVTPFAAMRSLGAGIAAADAAQACGALFAVAAMVMARRETINIQAAILLSCLPLLLSSMLGYDLCLCGLAIAFLAREIRLTGIKPWDRAAMALMFLLPAVAGLFRNALHLPLDTPLDVVIVTLLLARSRGEGAKICAPSG